MNGLTLAPGIGVWWILFDGLAESVADVLREQREAALLGSRHDLAVRRELAPRRDSAARRPAGGPVLLALAA